MMGFTVYFHKLFIDTLLHCTAMFQCFNFDINLYVYNYVPHVILKAYMFDARADNQKSKTVSMT